MEVKEGQFVVVTQGVHAGKKGWLARAECAESRANGCFWLVTREGKLFVWAEQFVRAVDVESHLLERMREIWSCQGLFLGGTCGAIRPEKQGACERFPHVDGPHECIDDDGCVVLFVAARCRWTARKSYSAETRCWECGGVGRVVNPEVIGYRTGSVEVFWPGRCKVCLGRGVVYAEHEAPFFEVRGELLGGQTKGKAS